MKLKDILARPIPDYSQARKQKDGFRNYPLLMYGPYSDEPVVDIAQYGIAGQSYYSRTNGATKQPIEWLEPRVYVRQSIAEKLAEINRTIQASPEVAEIYGGEVELFVQEGFRPVALQAKLYNEVFPRLIRTQYPDWTNEQVSERRDQLIANPKCTADSPPPHATGAAIDVTLRYKDADLHFVPGKIVDMGRKTRDMSLVANPDYYEHGALIRTHQAVQKHRRALYWIMRGATLGKDTGFVVNPTEWWHWSYGDQMWAHLTNAPAAFYGEAKI
jgi:zinc D-Ala-D-Ala dipeptidase